MFEPCYDTRYKYLKVSKEILTQIQPWLENLGLKYTEGHPIVPVDITEEQIKLIALTICSTKRWVITHELGKTIVTAVDKNSAIETFRNLPWGNVRWRSIIDIQRYFSWEYIEMYFLGQFEVYYSKLEWDLEEARKEAYENTLKHFNSIPKWETALEKFKNTYRG